MNKILSLFKPNYPPVSLLVESPYVSAVRVDKVGPHRQVLVRHQQEVEPWGEGEDGGLGLRPEEVGTLLVRLGNPKHLTLVMDDSFFRSQIIKLTEFPRAESERLQVIRWHLRKTVEYPMESARLRYVVLRRDPSAVSIWVSCVQEHRVGALEMLFQEKGCHVGFVGSSTVELCNLALARDMVAAEGTTLILNRTASSITFLFVEGGVPTFFRCKDHPLSGGDPSLEERLLQEVRLTLAFYNERNTGSPLKRVLVRYWPAESALPLEQVLADEEVLAMESIFPGGQMDAALLPLFHHLEGN